MSADPMPTRASDLPQLSAFLRAVFRAPPEARFAAEDVLAWKCLSCDPTGWVGLAYAPFGRLAKAGRWEISRVPRFDETTRSVLTSGPRPYGVAERTVAQLNHRLQCPAVATRGYVLRRLDKIEGYAIASVGTWEAKIVDIRLQSDDPQDWAAAYALVTDTLRREPAVCRISALASVPPLRKALEANS